MTDKEKKEIRKEIVTSLNKVINLTLKLTEAEHNERGMSIAWPLEFAEALKSADNLRASFINRLQFSDD
jgi:hypothetical protein